jgi:hypothetical protein
MPDFSVAVDGRDIVVSKPSAGLSVTYRIKQGRVLIAPELWRIKLSGEELNFYGRLAGWMGASKSTGEPFFFWTPWDPRVSFKDAPTAPVDSAGP